MQKSEYIIVQYGSIIVEIVSAIKGCNYIMLFFPKGIAAGAANHRETRHHGKDRGVPVRNDRKQPKFLMLDQAHSVWKNRSFGCIGRKRNKCRYIGLFS